MQHFIFPDTDIRDFILFDNKKHQRIPENALVSVIKCLRKVNGEIGRKQYSSLSLY